MPMNESPTVHPSGLAKYRLEALIDGVFAVALTLLVLDIRLPDNAPAPTDADLAAQLLTLERHFVIYIVSFIVIGMYWTNHHIQFHFVARTNRRLIWLNLAYLLIVSFLPFCTDLIGDHKNLVLPCEIYGVALLALSGVSFAHLEYLARHPELATAALTPDVVRLIRPRIALFAVLPLVSMAVAFVSTVAAVYIYALLVIAHFAASRVDRRITQSQSAAEGA
jgi:uncharacterized membrane protein